MDYLPNTQANRRLMMEAVGIKSTDELFSGIPEAIRETSFNIPAGYQDERQLFRFFRLLANENSSVMDYISYLGAGCYDHYVPALVKHIVSRPEFSTSYTPYQPEASQGTLQAIYEYQTLICKLTGMDVSNASMYDGASAMAEAALLSLRFNERKKVVILRSVHPEYREVVQTYLRNIDAEMIEISLNDGVADIEQIKDLADENVSCLIAQTPNFFGLLEPMDELARVAHSSGALFIASVNPMSLGVLKPPGEYGADIAVGEGQCLGNPLNFGGPGLGIFACKKTLLRKMPGRLVGATTDVDGKRGYVLSLQAREQHIRRQRATSNICTNESLCALAACVYLSWLGEKGIRDLGWINIENSHYCFERLTGLRYFEPQFSGSFFNEFVLKVKDNITQAELRRRLLKKKIIAGLGIGGFYPEYKDSILFCVTETKTKEDIDMLIETINKL